MLQKMRAIVGVGLAGQGGAVCVAPCAAAVLQPVLAPLSLKATNPAALYLVHAHQPNFHLLQEAPRPRCVAYVPQMHVLVAAAPPIAAAGPVLGRTIRCPQKWPPQTMEQPELLEIPVAHRFVSATSITNVS